MKKISFKAQKRKRTVCDDFCQLILRGFFLISACLPCSCSINSRSSFETYQLSCGWCLNLP
jgi:hypothetical protein